MFKITVEGKTVQTLKAELRKILVALTSDNAREDIVEPEVDETEAAEEAPIENPNKKSGKGRPRKPDLDPTKPASHAEAISEAAPKPQLAKETPKVKAPEAMKPVVEEAAGLKRTDLAPYLTKVSEVSGIATARQILGEFGAQRISEIKEEDFEAFVARCKASV